MVDLARQLLQARAENDIRRGIKREGGKVFEHGDKVIVNIHGLRLSLTPQEWRKAQSKLVAQRVEEARQALTQ